MPLRACVTVLVASSLIACGDSNRRTLRSLSGTQLTYVCTNFRPNVQTADEVRLVRQYAGKILRFEQDEGSEIAAEAVRTSLVAEDDAALERAVIEYMCRHKADHLREARFPERGSKPPELHLPVLDEPRYFDLDEHRGQIVVLNFWASWCKPCREEYPELVAVAHDYANSGVVVYGILYRDTPDLGRRWLEDHGRLPTLVDRDGATGRAYRVRGIPHTFIIDRDGTVGMAWAGYVPGKLEAGLREVLGAGPN